MFGGGSWDFWFCFCFFKTRSHDVPLAVLELTLETRLASNSQSYAYLYLFSDGIKGLCHVTLCSLLAFERRFHIAEAGFELLIFLFWSFQGWDYNNVPLLTLFFISFLFLRDRVS